MDEDSDTITRLADGDRSRTFSPSTRPTYQPWSRSNTGPAGSTGFQRTSSTEPVIRRQRSRQFSRTSVDTDSILLDQRSRNRTSNNGSDDTEDSTEQWHSIALIFVALPAFAGMFFENGSAVVTDMLMLGLGCLFLYWSVKWPWQWYYSTQEMKLADIDPNAEFAVFEDDSDHNEDDDELIQDLPSIPPKSSSTSETERPTSPTSPSRKKSPRSPTRQVLKRTSALQALQTLEIMALSSCFLSPAAVAYMLHTIRPYLSRPSGGVVSNSNLTLFVLAAELRPVLHFFRLVEERTLHLQKIVSTLPASEEKQLEDRVADLLKRIEDVEMASTKPALVPESSSGLASEKQDLASSVASTQSSSELERSLRSSLQPQLDALNRAVRRYEKRATTTAIVTEARLQDLEARLKDALSLAAAASRQSSKPGPLGQLSELVVWVLRSPLEAVRASVLLPVKVAGEVWRFLFGGRRRRKVRSGGGGGGGIEGRKWASEFKGKGRVEAR